LQPHAVPLHCKLATSSSCQRPPPPPPSPHLPHTAVIPGPFACRPPVPFVPCALGGSVLSPVDRPSLLVGVISNCLLSSQTKTLLPSQTSLALLIRARLCRIFYKKNLAFQAVTLPKFFARNLAVYVGRHSAEISGAPKPACTSSPGRAAPCQKISPCLFKGKLCWIFLSFFLSRHTQRCFRDLLCMRFVQPTSNSLGFI